MVLVNWFVDADERLEPAMPNEPELFQQRVEDLVKQVQEWVEPHEWLTQIYSKKMRDAENQVFQVPALFLQKGPMRVLLDPVAYDVPGSEAVVDLYLTPTYDDLASLYFENGAWMIHYSVPSDLNETQTLPFSAESLNSVLDSIAAHAAPTF